MKTFLLWTMHILLGVFIVSTTVKAETFAEKDRPFFEYNSIRTQYMLKPWNYDNAENCNREYPLVVYLHGHGDAKKVDFLNFIGYDNPEDEKIDSIAFNFQKEHPCFVLIPQTNSFWDKESLIEQVEKFKSEFRIDKTRIYLIGYSMGGSGSWSFANAYNKYNGHLFAGIIRLAGQSQDSVTKNIAEHTAMWLHIGLDDIQSRIDVTRKVYNFLREYCHNPTETKSAVAIANYSGTTYSLVVDGKDKIKRTEYNGIGHGVKVFPFRDPYLIKWLFNQKL